MSDSVISLKDGLFISGEDQEPTTVLVWGISWQT